MSEADITLKELFALDAEKIAANAKSALAASQGTALLKEKLLKEVKRVPWPSVGDAILGKVGDLLDIKLVDVLVLAWKKYRLLAKYADRDRYSPDEVVLVPLATHTVTAEQHPYIEILVREQPLGKIVFDVSLSLMLEGFVLKIQDGKIKAIQTGSWQGKGTIALEKETLVEKDLGPVTLPGSIDLGEGISLRGSPATG
jgi:hypothetical protein